MFQNVTLLFLPTGVAFRSEVDVFGGVCSFITVFVRTITSERLNVGQSNLAARYTVQQSRPGSKIKVKGHGLQGQKKEKLLTHPQ